MATPTNLPAAQTTGNVLTAAYMNDLRGAFRILQINSSTTSTNATSANTTLVTTNLSVSITPQSASSKILVMCCMTGCKTAATNTGIQFSFFRGASNVLTFAKAGGFSSASNDNNFETSGLLFDSPNTTSATTYEVKFCRSEGSGTVECQQGGNTTSTIIVMEVSA